MYFKKILFSIMLGITIIQEVNAASSELFETIASGDISKVKNYLENHPETSLKYTAATSHNHDYALHIAVQRQNNPDMVRFLLDKGAAIEIFDDLNNTPLYYAVRRYLNARDTDEMQSLKRMITILLTHGANPDRENNTCTARSLAPDLIKEITK